MKTYLAYKNQIGGLEDVLETVKAVEQIAASSVHWLKQQVFNLNNYASDIEALLSDLLKFNIKVNHPLLKKGVNGKKMLVVVSGDKGLVGGLWHDITNTFLNEQTRYQEIIIIGKKGEGFFNEEGFASLKTFADLSDIPDAGEVSLITDFIFGRFKGGNLSGVDILYPRFISLAAQEPANVNFLPFTFSVEGEAQDSGENAMGLPIFEPGRSKIFNHALEKHIGVFFYKIILESKLSELSARTVAMEHASAKTDQLLKKMNLDYAKERRSEVTRKQLESFTGHMSSSNL